MYKTILLHLDSGERTAVRLRIALAVAQRFGARLIGVFAQLDHDAISLVARRASDHLVAAGDAAEASFREAAAAAGVAADFVRLPHGEHSFVIREMVICSRFADLVVVGQYEAGRAGGLVPAELNEELILNSGGPVLVLPYAGRFETLGERVMVAWNGSREAARAVRDALPLIAGAREVRVLGLHVHDDRSAEDLPKLNIVSRLADDGIAAKYEVLAPQDIGVMDMILSRCADEGSDLLVMGGHGQYGFPYLHRGSGTRHILRHMTLPVLMAH